jgi:hypothetical protein
MDGGGCGARMMLEFRCPLAELGKYEGIRAAVRVPRSDHYQLFGTMRGRGWGCGEGKAVVEGLEDCRTGGSVGSLNRSLDGALE